MTSQPWPQIRNDDVLQTKYSTTSAQRKVLRGRDLFTLFVEADKVLEQYDHPTTLAVLSEGIEVYPEWVDYIKKRIHRYDIQLHGSVHKNYKDMSHRKLYRDLKGAKEKIEETFGITISVWYPPFGRKGENPRSPEVCEALGIRQFEQYGKVDAKFWLQKPESYPHVNYHFWHPTQVGHVNKIVCRLHEKQS